jgi:hypothetical protein
VKYIAMATIVMFSSLMKTVVFKAAIVDRDFNEITERSF